MGLDGLPVRTKIRIDCVLRMLGGFVITTDNSPRIDNAKFKKIALHFLDNSFTYDALPCGVDGAAG